MHAVSHDFNTQTRGGLKRGNHHFFEIIAGWLLVPAFLTWLAQVNFCYMQSGCEIYNS